MLKSLHSWQKTFTYASLSSGICPEWPARSPSRSWIPCSPGFLERLSGSGARTERLRQGSGSRLDPATTRAETWGAAERSFTKLSLSALPALVSKTDGWVALRKSWTRPGHQNFKDKREFQRRTSGAQSFGCSVFDGASLCLGS